MEFEYKIPFRPPSVNTYWRRVRNRFYISEAGQKFKYNVRVYMMTQKKKLSKEKLEVDLILNFKDKTVRDIDNFCKGIFDSLTGILWKDDSQIIKLHITKNTDTKESDNFILRVREVENDGK